nr:reverse transcriptase domain-containing protein [Tanacetum cinerariifolium]
ASPAIVDPLWIELPFLEDQFQEDPPKDPPEVPMADEQTMAELLRAPTEGYEDAIVIPEIAANNFKLKHVVAKVSTSSSTPAVSSEVSELKDLVRALLLDKKNQSSAPASSSTPALVKAIEPNYVTCGGTHSYQNCPATSENVYRDNIQEYVSQAVAANYNQGNTSFRPQMVANQIRPPGFPPHQNNQNNFNRGNNSIKTKVVISTNLISTKVVISIKANFFDPSGVAYQGPPIPTPSKVMKQGTEVTKDQVQTPSLQSTAPIQPSVIQSKTQTPVSEPVVAPVSVPMPNLKSYIPYPSRHDNERRPLIGNKEKLSEMARTPMNEHCSAVILNKLPRKLGDPSKFLIPFEFPRMDECLALADLGASINLMPLFVWEGLLLLELTSTYMTLKFTDRSVFKPIGIAKDVSVKVGVFHFPADFVVVDFEPDPRVPLILERCFLKTDRALIDVHKGKLTLRIENEAITYNLDQTSRYYR